MIFKNDKNGKWLGFVVAMGVLLLAVVLFIVFYLRSDDDAGENEPSVIESVSEGENETDNKLEETQRGEALVLPTNPPEEKEEQEDVAGTSYVYLYNAKELQKELLSMVGDSSYTYGTKYRNGKLTSGGFAGAFYPEFGEKIKVEEVGIGDVGKGSGFTGICVGFDGGVPVFAYAYDKPITGVMNPGVCMGYVRNLADMTFCGMYPVDFTEFYDCCNTAGDNDVFQEKGDELLDGMAWYADAIYDCGRAFSNGNAEGLMDLMPEGILHQHNVKVLPEEFSKFLAGFGEQCGFSGKEYAFYVVEEEYSGDDYSSLTVGCLSLEEDTYLRSYGEWDVTIYENFEFLPCRAYVSSYIGVCGFVPANDVSVKEDSEGNIVVEKEEIVYGLTVDENGRPIYRAYDGSVMYLDTREPSDRQGR